MQRPLSKDEISLLKHSTARTFYFEIARGVLFGLVFVFSLVFIIGKVLLGLTRLLSAAGEVQGALLLASVVTLAAAYKIMQAIRRTPAKDSFHAKVQADLANGVAEETEYAVLSAAELEEYEDEGTGFFLELEGERVLFVAGQDLYAHAHDAVNEDGKPQRDHTFPATRIVYTEAPLSKRRLGVRGTGAPLPVKDVVKGGERLYKKVGKTRIYAGPEDGMIYAGTLDAVLDQFSLRRKQKPQ